MKSEIRRIFSEADFQGVYELFDGKKTIEELKWLYLDPNNSNVYNAFVAKSEINEIIGVIGYQTSKFKQGDKELIGVIPYDWKIADYSKGMHGVMLFKKVFEFGDFVYEFGGTKIAQKIFPMFKLKNVSNFIKYYKILNLRDFNTSLKISNLKRRISLLGYLIPSLFVEVPKKMLYKDINLIDYTKNSLLFKEREMIFEKKITRNYIAWLIQCPVVESYAFNIKKGDSNLGVCVCFIQKVNSINIGRIVYLPFLGYDVKIWVTVIDKCLIFFKKNSCAVVSAIGHHPMNQLGLKKAGFMGNNLIKQPVFISDVNQKLGFVDFNSWHVQYSEGDQMHRNF